MAPKLASTAVLSPSSSSSISPPSSSSGTISSIPSPLPSSTVLGKRTRAKYVPSEPVVSKVALEPSAVDRDSVIPSPPKKPRRSSIQQQDLSSNETSNNETYTVKELRQSQRKGSIQDSSVISDKILPALSSKTDSSTVLPKLLSNQTRHRTFAGTALRLPSSFVAVLRDFQRLENFRYASPSGKHTLASGDEISGLSWNQLQDVKGVFPDAFDWSWALPEAGVGAGAVDSRARARGVGALPPGIPLGSRLVIEFSGRRDGSKEDLFTASAAAIVRTAHTKWLQDNADTITDPPPNPATVSTWHRKFPLDSVPLPTAPLPTLTSFDEKSLKKKQTLVEEMLASRPSAMSSSSSSRASKTLELTPLTSAPSRSELSRRVSSASSSSSSASSRAALQKDLAGLPASLIAQVEARAAEAESKRQGAVIDDTTADLVAAAGGLGGGKTQADAGDLAVMLESLPEFLKLLRPPRCKERRAVPLTELTRLTAQPSVSVTRAKLRLLLTHAPSYGKLGVTASSETFTLAALGTRPTYGAICELFRSAARKARGL